MNAPRRACVRFLADHPGLAPVVAGWLLEEWGRPLGVSPAAVQRSIRARLNRSRLPLSLVALSGSSPVGTVSLVADGSPIGNGPSCFLSGLFVPPAWRGRGIGARLCRRAALAAERFSAPELFLLTLGRETYYARLGWLSVPDAPLPESLGVGNASLMRLPLSARSVPRRPTAVDRRDPSG